MVGAAHNSQAERFFQRDLENLRRFFAALDPALHAAASDGREIWRAYVRRELTPDFVPAPRPPRQQGASPHAPRQEGAPPRHAPQPQPQHRRRRRRSGRRTTTS